MAEFATEEERQAYDLGVLDGHMAGLAEGRRQMAVEIAEWCGRKAGDSGTATDKRGRLLHKANRVSLQVAFEVTQDHCRALAKGDAALRTQGERDG